MKVLLSAAEAAKAMGVSKNHVKKLINEADSSPKSRWRYGREIVDFSPADAALHPADQHHCSDSQD